MAHDVICLDTNYLILGLVPGSPEGDRLREWTATGTRLVAPAVVWFEFLCGPVSARQVETMRAFLHEVIPFAEPQAGLAATLYNDADRGRSTRVDAMIAATDRRWATDQWPRRRSGGVVARKGTSHTLLPACHAEP